MSDQQKTNATQRRLLVPMDIEALVVPERGTGESQWVDLKPDFRKIKSNRFLGHDLEKIIGMNIRKNLHEPGVHLHWALPDGLAHGVAGDNGEGPEFPLIPNRWLIVRFWDQGLKNRELDLEFRTWIVESDTITTEHDAVVWPQLPSSNQQNYYVRVGNQFEMTRWPGETSAPSVDITAVGYGDPAFAADYLACKGILGFHDKDLEDLRGVPLTYFVAGWYSDPSKDPLHRALTEKTFEKLDEFLGEKKWTYPGLTEALEKVERAKDLEVDLNETGEMMERLKKTTPDSTEVEAELQKKTKALKNQLQSLTKEIEGLAKDMPGQILCHGVISGIQWQNKDTLYKSGIPRDKPFRVAVGDTAVEALTALFKEKLNGKLAKLLEAFQYDLLTELEKPGGHAKVEHKIHERTFRPLSRGIRWDLIQEAQPATGDSFEEHAPPIPGDIRALLENLNHRQRQIDGLKRERDSVKRELYATWYKRILNIRKEHVSGETLNQRLKDLQKEIENLTTQIVELEDQKEGRPKGVELKQLQENLETLLPDYKIQPVDESRFWRPNDPVVLLAGEAFQRSSRHAEDGRYRSDGQLLCRLDSQEITRIIITIPHAKKKGVEFGPDDLDRWGNPFAAPAEPPIPPDVVNLFRESLLLTLDSKRAHDIAAAAYEKNEPGLARDHPTGVSRLSKNLLQFLKTVLNDAENPDLAAPKVKYEKKDENGEIEALELAGIFPSPLFLTRWRQNPWLPLFLHWQASWMPAYFDIRQALENWNLAKQGAGFDFRGEDPGREDHKRFVYNGTTLLTPSAALNFSDRLRQYNLTHDNPKLEEFQTKVSSMNLLCQSLGGLTDQLLMRKGRLELKPLDPGSGGRGPQLSEIFHEVEDIDWLSPLTDSKFFPIRAGHLKLEKLWVSDAYGQLLKLEEISQEKITHPVLPERLAGSSGYIRLEPRLAQPARLTIQWPPAGRWGSEREREQDVTLQEDEEFSPVCGWILPNFLDSGLMIYDARGNAVGALQAVQRKSWKCGVGGQKEEIESFHWVDIPGSEQFFFGKPPNGIPDPLGEGANPHLRAFVKGLLALAEGGGQAFGRLLEKMNEVLSASGGTGPSQNPNLALLIGKPLALVRASIRLELDGRPACAQGWDDLKGEQTGGIEKVKFPIRLGDRWKWNDVWLGDDGLVGFFLNQNYERFYPAFGLTSLDGRNDRYSEYGMVPGISVSEPLNLTLLMDPFRGFCATTGIFPRKIFNLPHGDITETLENKQVVFFTGPLVSTEAEIRMPQPSDIYGQWSWTHHPEVKVWREETITDYRREQGRFFENTLHITEGWLKLVTAPLAIRVFKVKGKEPVKKEEDPEKAGEAPTPAQFEVCSGENMILSWVVTGAEKIELKKGVSSLLQSNRHPLPTQYRIQVDQKTSFTLIATDREKKTVEKSIKIKTVQKSN
jgi:archaellum component FlaC